MNVTSSNLINVSGDDNHFFVHFETVLEDVNQLGYYANDSKFSTRPSQFAAEDFPRLICFETVAPPTFSVSGYVEELAFYLVQVLLVDEVRGLRIENCDPKITHSNCITE